MTKVGFIGLGSMGGPQARLIARDGFELAVFDPYAPALNAFEGIARLAESPKDAAVGAEIVCVCVRDDEQVRSVIFGESGVAAGLSAGGMIIIHSTIRASTLRAIRDGLAKKGITVIDAAVSRTVIADHDRFVISIVGGEDDEVARARPVLEAFSTEIAHVGPAGAGVTAKIANNMITWTHIVVGMQAAALAEENSVSLDQLRGILKANGNLTPPVASLLGAKISNVPIPGRDELVRSQTGIGEKDLTLAAESLSAAGLAPDQALATRALVAFAMLGKLEPSAA